MTSPTDSSVLPAERPARDTDEALVGRLRLGDEDALRALHHRYAALVFTIAARFVDAATAEEVAQDVFVTIWKKHATFDAERGTFKSWVVQIARRRALNELRRKEGRGPQSEEGLAQLADDALEPDEAQWLARRRDVIRAAVDALPPAQRQALSLAFFDELTHEQIASILSTPVGTTKTRISLALKRLAPLLMAAFAAMVILLVVRREQETARGQEALRMVTASDVVPLRLEPAEGVPRDAHGTYRTRPGARVAVLTTSHLPALASPAAYYAWAHRADGWHRLGRTIIESDGRSVLVSEVDVDEAPDEIRVTRETGSPGDVPRGPTVLAWSASGVLR
jgi:RNA polymerase sigma factor (sigma-70 family)